MDITVKGLKHPHRYVLDAAQTHIYMLMKKVGRLAESARKSSRLWVPGCGGRGRVWSWPCCCWVQICQLCLPPAAGLAPSCAPEPSGQGGAAAEAQALSGLLTLQLKGCPDIVTHQLPFPPCVREGSLLSTFSPAVFACRLLHDGRSDGCEVAPHWGFALHCSGN